MCEHCKIAKEIRLFIYAYRHAWSEQRNVIAKRACGDGSLDVTR